jgi:hypothetical protein
LVLPFTTPSGLEDAKERLALLNCRNISIALIDPVWPILNERYRLFASTMRYNRTAETHNKQL